MLSKEVKLRRRINRKRRKQPAWRSVMQTLKQHEINLLKMQFNSVFGAFMTPSDAAHDIQKYHRKRQQLSHEQRHMTRLEFYQERGRTYDWRKGAQIIAKSNIKIADDCLKIIKKHR